MKLGHDIAVPQLSCLTQKMLVLRETIFQSFISMVFIPLMLYGLFFAADFITPANFLGIVICFIVSMAV